MIELVDWETYCPSSRSINNCHCICFRAGNGEERRICCECKREALPKIPQFNISEKSSPYESSDPTFLKRLRGNKS